MLVFKIKKEIVKNDLEKFENLILFLYLFNFLLLWYNIFDDK